jgi:ABC-type Mn2+/Zn2+ transport system ATPase subunit
MVLFALVTWCDILLVNHDIVCSGSVTGTLLVNHDIVCSGSVTGTAKSNRYSKAENFSVQL